MIPATLDFPAINGQPVTQAHTDLCAATGHVSYVIAGVEQGICPRCGVSTEPPAKAVHKFTPRGVAHAVTIIGTVHTEGPVTYAAETACGRALDAADVAALEDGVATCGSCARVLWRAGVAADEARELLAAPAVHDEDCRAHAIGCAVENIAGAATSRDLDVSDWAAEADAIAEGDRYLEDGTASCLCGTDTTWAQKWIALGRARLEVAELVAAAEVPRTLEGELIVRAKDVTGTTLWTPLVEATHAIRFRTDGPWHPATGGDAKQHARQAGPDMTAVILCDDDSAHPRCGAHCDQPTMMVVTDPVARLAPCSTCGRSRGWNGHAYTDCLPRATR